MKFDGTDGRLEFNSSSSVKAVAAFYRGSLTSQGWKEKPSIINQPNMAVMEFSRGGKSVSLTAMQMGPKVKVSADGSGLEVAEARIAAKSGAAGAKDNNEPAGKAVDEPLEAEAELGFAGAEAAHHAHDRNRKMPGSDAPFRRELEASVPAELNRCWRSTAANSASAAGRKRAEGAIVKPDQVQLAFTSPDGPATLKLGRRNGETSVNLAQKYPAAAAKADVVPKPGQSKLMFGNIGKK